MAVDFYLECRGRKIALLSFEHVQAEGRVAPRLMLFFEARAADPSAHLELHRLRVEVRLKNERLGVGELQNAVAHVFSHESQLVVELPLTQQAVQFLAEQGRSNQIELFLDMTGFARFRTEGRGSRGEIENPGAWEDADVDREQGTIRIPLSTWISSVVEPTGTNRFVFLEVPIPKTPDRARWEVALGHLAAAEQFYAEGRDAEVLQRCYAAYESLDGAPKGIFDKVADEKKRQRLNESLKDVKGFMQGGRHVAEAGRSDGDFAVDHRDAAFALGQTKIWLSYIAHLAAD
jgi:hypothetical protein